MPQNTLEMIQNLMRGAFDPSSVGTFLNQGLPGAPSFTSQMGSLEDISNQLMGLFAPAQKEQLLQNLLQQGTSQITQAGAGARRAIGSRGAASGLSDSSPITGQIAETFAGEQQAFAGLQGQATQAGIGFDQAFMQALLGAAGIQGQQAGLLQQGFGNELSLAQLSSQSLPNFLDIFGQLGAINQLGGFRG